VDLFGWKIERVTNPEQKLESFAPKIQDDGAVVVHETGGTYGVYLDQDGAVKTESELVTRYREMSLQPEVDSAIDDIVNEMIAYDDNEDLVKIDLDNTKLPDPIKNRIRKEFSEVLRLFDFNNSAYDICRRWYIDGRMYYHAMIDEQHPDQGIKELRYIDPRKLRKVREIKRTRQANGGINTIVKTANEYYVYNDRGFAMKETNVTGYQSATGIRIAPDTILHATSGLMDSTNQLVLSYLHKAIKPLNQLRMLEDAAVIYRLVRAPERRAFYIDVGSLPKAKAEQYLRDMMVKHKNKVVYDSASGEVRDDRKFMTMLEDYWLPRREGGRGTEIQTLPGGENLGEMEDVEYFLKKLYKSLNVPTSRLQSDSSFNMGRSSEITRDELKFGKFVDRLRLRFSMLLWKALEKQLVLKRVISQEEGNDLWHVIKFDFAHDSYFTELKELEIMQQRVALLGDLDAFTGKYWSTDWVKRNILRQDDEVIEEQKKLMDEDDLNAPPVAPNPEGGPDSGDDQQMQGPGGPPGAAAGAPGFSSAPAAPPAPAGQGMPGGPDGPKAPPPKS
jgi:hypothetical protein